MNKYRLMIILGATLISQLVLASSATTAHNDAAFQANIDAGEQIFSQVCAACHGKDLSGGAGFNLKDGEWIHGDSPEDILNSIKQGFNQAGMPAFGNVFSEQQLQDVVAFILSKRQGLGDLNYKVYQLQARGDVNLSDDNLVKQGSLTSNLMDFEIPETEFYAIEFEGDLYAPKTPSKLFIEGWIPTPIKVQLDGQDIPRNGRAAIWSLKPGKQRLMFQFIVNARVKQHWKKNLAIFVTNQDLGIKHFSISKRGQMLMQDKKIHVEVSDSAIVLRKKVRDLPPYSIAVGLPQKINYAFNTRRCNIVGVWSGELLNIGPNVEGRGKDASLILGDWLFNSQDMLVINDAKQCQYRKFVNGPSPAFHFTLDNVEYRLTTEKHSAKGLTFVYQVLANPDNRSQKITLPLKPQLQVSSSGGKTLDGLMQVESNVSRFTINIVKE